MNEIKTNEANDTATNTPIVVTRHDGLVKALQKMKVVGDDVEIIAHATPDKIAGRWVIGVLPIHLAALCAKVTVVEMNIPAEKRGQELTAEEVIQFNEGKGVATYVVTRL